MTPPAGGPARYSPDFLSELFRNPLDPGYADAAARRAAQGPDGPRRVFIGRVARALVLILTGFLFATAYEQAVAAQPAATRARAGLVRDAKARQAETNVLQNQADTLRDDVNRLRETALAGAGPEAQRLRDLEVAAGLVKVHGNGAVVRLADAPTPLDPVTGQPAETNPGKVLDRDLQDVANALWAAGAEAIAINGERLTSTSTIRTAGGAILVDFRPVTSPYEVAAIGPSDLDKRFAASPTGKRFARYVNLYRMQFSVKKRNDLTLPAGTDDQLRYAHLPGAAPSGAPASPAPSEGHT